MLIADSGVVPESGVILDFVIVNSVPVPPGAVSWWPAGGNANDAFGVNDGSLRGEITFAPGKVGQGFSQDGYVDSANVGNPVNLQLQDFTIEAWIKRASTTSASLNYGGGIFFSHGWGGYGFGVVDDGSLFLTRVGIDNVTLGQAITDTDWHHVAVTKSGTEAIIYVDGNGYLMPEYETLYEFYSAFAIGARGDYDLNSFLGSIDELTIYNRALSPSEIDDIYQASGAGKLNPNCSPLPAQVVSWWPADGDVYDYIGANNAVLQNGTTCDAAVVGSGFNFDGVNDGVTVEDFDDSLDVGANDNLTIEAWISALPHYTTWGVTTIVDKRETPNSYQCLGYVFCLVNGQVACRISDSISGVGVGWGPAGPNLVTAGGYHHVALTLNRGSTSGGHMYVDGMSVLEFNPTVVAGSLFNNQPFRIGVHAQTDFNGYHKGIIDELTIYKRELSATEISAIYSAGCAGKCKDDLDRDTLPDWWERTYFGNMDHTAGEDYDNDGLTNLQESQTGTNPTRKDTDGDGLFDGEETAIPLDTWYPALGYLNPLDPDTGASGRLDGDKDSDHDGLSNLGELRKYGSNPSDAYSLNFQKNGQRVNNDGVFLFAASRDDPNVQAVFRVQPEAGNVIHAWIENPPPGLAWDIFYKENFGVPKMRPIYSGSPGQADFRFPDPAPGQGYFTALASADDDGDGVTNGEEVWWIYAAIRGTEVNRPDSDDDLLRDGWEREYGLDPRSNMGTEGASADPEGDGNNLTEHNQYYGAAAEFDARRDPLKAASAVRPVITISSSDQTAEEPAGTASFTLNRDLGTGTGTDLKVYYTIGGTASYDTDYTLDDPGNDLPRIFSAIIPGTAPSVTVTVTALPDSTVENTETLVVRLVPFGLGVSPQQSDRSLWLYAVDFNHDRVMISIRDRVCHTYEYNADFLMGLFMGTVATADQVHLQSSSQPQFPFINVACSGRNTVARINVNTGAIVGEYRTAPDGREADPSRTTVDQFGNVWVANRAEAGLVDGVQMGSITRIGLIIGGTRCDGNGQDNPNGQFLKPPFDYSTVADRDGDGLIKTSRGLGNFLGWPNSITDVDTKGGVSTAEDEAITAFVRVRGFLTRTIAVDKFNDLWVGGTGDLAHQKVNGLLAQVIPTSTFFPGCGGYGGVIDMNGNLWSSGHTVSSLLRFEPPTSFPPSSSGDCLGADGGNYGLAVDPVTGRIWHTWDSFEPFGRITRWEPDGQSFQNFDNHGWPCSQGVVVDASGNVWVAHATAGFGNCGEVHDIGHLRNDGITFVGNVNLTFGNPPVIGTGPTGLSVDSNGKIWVVCKESNNAFRIDPNGGDIAGGGHRRGAVDMAPVDLGSGALPYNYSDMTGFNNRIVNPEGCPLRGSWTVTEDGLWANSRWDTVSWVANTPEGTTIEVFARASDKRTELSTKQFVAVVNGVPLSGVRGRFLEVTTILTRNNPNACAKDPYLDSLTICRLSPTLTTTALEDQIVIEGQDAQFQVAASGTEPLTYQWFFNGVAIPNVNGPTLSLPSADCLDNGKYNVRITDASGDTIEAGPATLTVIARPIVIPSQGAASIYPAKISVANETRTIASVEVTLSDFNHSRPADVDMLLVSPTGKKIMLMSDAGGLTPVVHLNITFTESGSTPQTPLPSNTTVSFVPTNLGEQETSLPTSGNPSPPAGPYADSLSDLQGTSPNGDWLLYVVDDAATGAGSISGSWCLTLTLNP
jgi:streptogramin lyase